MVYLLSDTISRIHLGGQRKLKYVISLNSMFCLKILKTLFFLGFLKYVRVLNFKYLQIYLKYSFNSSVIRGISVLTKNKYKIYLSNSSLKVVVYKNKFLSTGFLLCSVSHKNEIFTDVECIMNRIGGVGLIYVT